MNGPKRDMKVLGLGLPRTGSTSMTAALEKLGYHNVYHCSKAMDRNRDWEIFDLACDAHFKCLSTYSPGHEFSRREWDMLFGSCEAVTDAAGMFAEQLIKIYPDAKVVLTERDFDKWENSMFNHLVPVIWSRFAMLYSFVEYWAGFKGGVAARKMILGLFGVADISQAKPKAREAFDRHHRIIKEMVPPEQLLIYKMGQGWGPLCDFLGKEVPRNENGEEIPFPWLNEVNELQAIALKRVKKSFRLAGLALLPYVVGLLGVAAGLWLMLHQRASENIPYPP